MKTEKKHRKFVNRLRKYMKQLPLQAAPFMAGLIEQAEDLLKGEPRYSIAELKKILKKLPVRDKYGDYHEMKDFIVFLKDKKKVEAILNA